MFRLQIYETDYWDDERERFYKIPNMSLKLEHSLISISRWEMHYKKPFLSEKEKTIDEFDYYIKCMVVNMDPDDIPIQAIKTVPTLRKNLIRRYIDDEKIAFKFKKEENGKGKPGKATGDPMSSEFIYYYMIQLEIPFSCEKWHLSRLLALIRICALKGATPEKKSMREMAKGRTAMNQARRAAAGSKG